MKYLLYILCLLVLSCDSGDNNTIFYAEYYMLLIDGAIDNNQLLPIGETADDGSFEYNNKSSFPTLSDYDHITMEATDEMGNPLATVQLDDYIDETFKIIFEKESEFSTLIYDPSFILEDKINIFNVILSESGPTISRTESTGDFNIVFNIQDEDGFSIEGVSVYMQYYMPEIGEGHGNEELLFRPTTRIDYSVANQSTIRFIIELLDGAIIQEWTNFYDQGENYFYFEPPVNEITAGLQVYKYSMEVLEEGEPDGRNDGGNSPTPYALSQNYPNPFN